MAAPPTETEPPTPQPPAPQEPPPAPPSAKASAPPALNAKSIRHIMRQGQEPTVADDAVEAVQECSTQFLSLVASEARAKVAREGRAEVTEADMMAALQTLGFKGFADTIRGFMSAHYGNGRAVQKAGLAQPWQMQQSAAKRPRGDYVNCGQCRACLDKPAFGGPGKLKQACKNQPPEAVIPRMKKAAGPPGFSGGDPSADVLAPSAPPAGSSLGSVAQAAMQAASQQTSAQAASYTSAAMQQLPSSAVQQAQASAVQQAQAAAAAASSTAFVAAAATTSAGTSAEAAEAADEPAPSPGPGASAMETAAALFDAMSGP